MAAMALNGSGFHIEVDAGETVVCAKGSEVDLMEEVCERVLGCPGLTDPRYTGCVDRRDAFETCGYENQPELHEGVRE